MNSKQYDIKLEIDVENVTITCPSGKSWRYDRNNLPAHIHDLAYRCLQDDANLCTSIAASLKAAATTAMVVLAVLVSSTCFAQSPLESYQSNPLRGGYERFGDRYDLTPPRLCSGGAYLGELSLNRYLPDSISNPYGRYGSRYSPSSINNPYGPYGRYSSQPIWIYSRRY